MSLPGKAALLATNDIEASQVNHYLLGSADPYLVFSSPEIINNQVQLPIKLVKSAKSSNIELELFFAGKKTAKNYAFDARKRLKLEVSADNWRQLDGIKFDLPKGLSLGEFIRLDFNDCSECEFKIDDQSNAFSSTSAKVTSVRQGLQALGDQVKPIIESGGWFDHDTNTNGQIIGIDPFIVSPSLDASTEDLAGVYFEITTQSIEKKLTTFQLFYATESHDFIESISQYIELSPQEPGIYKFFLPLDFLAKQNPPSRILEQLRLDMVDGIDHWQLHKALLVPSSLQDQYQQWQPNLFVQKKHQKAGKRQILRDILSRLGRDPWFIVLYSLLLITTITLLWRQRKA